MQLSVWDLCAYRLLNFASHLITTDITWRYPENATRRHLYISATTCVSSEQRRWRWKKASSHDWLECARARAVFAGWIPIMPYYLRSTPLPDTMISYRLGGRSRWIHRGCPICDINTTDLRPLYPSFSCSPFLCLSPSHTSAFIVRVRIVHACTPTVRNILWLKRISAKRTSVNAIGCKEIRWLAGMKRKSPWNRHYILRFINNESLAKTRRVSLRLALVKWKMERDKKAPFLLPRSRGGRCALFGYFVGVLAVRNDAVWDIRVYASDSI